MLCVEGLGQRPPASPGTLLTLAPPRYLLTFDTTRVHEDLGLTFPGVRIVYVWSARTHFGARLTHLARAPHRTSTAFPAGRR